MCPGSDGSDTLCVPPASLHPPSQGVPPEAYSVAPPLCWQLRGPFLTKPLLEKGDNRRCLLGGNEGESEEKRA